LSDEISPEKKEYNRSIVNTVKCTNTSKVKNAAVFGSGNAPQGSASFALWPEF
jgi:hypothetical protein